MKRELAKIAIVSSSIYFGGTFMLSGIGFVFTASFASHGQSVKTALLTDEQAITTSAPHRFIRDAREFIINTDREEHIVYLNPVRSSN